MIEADEPGGALPQLAVTSPSQPLTPREVDMSRDEPDLIEDEVPVSLAGVSPRRVTEESDVIAVAGEIGVLCSECGLIRLEAVDQ